MVNHVELDSNGLEVLSRDECLRLLATALKLFAEGRALLRRQYTSYVLDGALRDPLNLLPLLLRIDIAQTRHDVRQLLPGGRKNLFNPLRLLLGGLYCQGGRANAVENLSHLSGRLPSLPGLVTLGARRGTITIAWLGSWAIRRAGRRPILGQCPGSEKCDRRHQTSEAGSTAARFGRAHGLLLRKAE